MLKHITLCLTLTLIAAVSGCAQLTVSATGLGPTRDEAAKNMLAEARETINLLNPTYELFPTRKVVYSQTTDPESEFAGEDGVVWVVDGQFKAIPPR